MAELVRAISEEAPAPVAPASVVLRLPRPRPLARILVLTAVILCALLAAMLFGLTRHVQGLMADIRQQEDQRANPVPPPLPAPERLLDEAAFAIACAARPADIGRLHMGRAHALVAGHPAEAIAEFALAARLNDTPLLAADRIALGEALLAIGRTAEARTMLLSIDATRLDQELLALGNDALGRVVMAERRAERQHPVVPAVH